MILGHPEFSVTPTHQPPQPDSWFFCLQDGKLLMQENEGELCFPKYEQLHDQLMADFVPFELAHVGTRLILSAPPIQKLVIEETAALRWVDFSVFRTQSFETAGLMCACHHLWRWYENNRFCGKCGSAMKPDSTERALRCSCCGHLIFPVIAPAVIVAITCRDRILLARNQRYQHYALIAGYVEVGETLEHALKREVMEEVGLEIHNIRYLGDQPWGVSGSHMFAFHAQADDQAPIRIQESELKDARWFDRSEVQPIQHKVSIAYELMERFRSGTL